MCNWLLSDLAPGPASPFPSPSSYLGLLVSFRGLTTYSAQDRSHLRQSRFKPYYLWFSIISLPAALFLRLAPCLTNQAELLSFSYHVSLSQDWETIAIPMAGTPPPAEDGLASQTCLTTCFNWPWSLTDDHYPRFLLECPRPGQTSRFDNSESQNHCGDFDQWSDWHMPGETVLCGEVRVKGHSTLPVNV